MLDDGTGSNDKFAKVNDNVVGKFPSFGRWQCTTTISIVQLCTMFHYPFSVTSMYTLNHLIILTSDWKPLWDEFSTLREIFVGNFSCFCERSRLECCRQFPEGLFVDANISPSLAMIIRPNWHNWKWFQFICLWLLSGLLKITFHWLWVEFQLQPGDDWLFDEPEEFLPELCEFTLLWEPELGGKQKCEGNIF